ncbi:Ankyrin repeat [Arabidopsis suecica]|uniref:Ankyrin repeat n=1 Tax=Arabidopsis suecica TaxID=45249 RepID=A0A8T2CLQ0_ARASU|nr:Ankyrin repeat [Arabidopsis suecica]
MMIQDKSHLKPLEKKKMVATVIDSILGNNVSTLLALAEENPSVLRERYHRDTLGGTVLHLATKLGHKEIVETIIKLCPSLVGVTNLDGDTPLHFAARWGHATIVAQILASGYAEFTALNGRGETAFVVACRYTHPDVASLILEETSSIMVGEFYATFVLGEYTDIARRMLEKFPKLAWNADGELSTPLHYACNANNLEITKMLLEIDGSLAERVNKDGFTPLHMAAMKCSIPILKEFSDKAPRSFDILTPAKETVFHLAAEHKNTPAFFFMAESPDRNNLLHQVDRYGNTVLHIAVMSTCYSVIVYITYDTTIDISAKNTRGLEAVDLINVDDEDYGKISGWLRFDAKQIRNPIGPQQGNYNIGNISEYKMQMFETYEAPTNKESKMHAEALQNARNTITIVAVLIASVAFTCGINPPGGVYQEGPYKGKSTAGTTLAFKIFSISNNIALFTSLCIVILLVSIIPYRTRPLMNFLKLTHRMLWVAVASMALAYVAAASIIIPHIEGTRWLFTTVLSISTVMLGGLFAFMTYKLFRHWLRKFVWNLRVTSLLAPVISFKLFFISVATDRQVTDNDGYYFY